MILRLFVICLGCVLVALLRIYLTKRRIKNKLGHVPTVRNEWPIIGHGHWFLFRNTTQIMDTLIKISSDQETPSKFWLGPMLTIIVNKPDDMKSVLMSPNCLQKPYMYNFVGSTKGLFNSPAHIWKKDRKFINPTFNNKILNSFVPIFNEKVQVLVKKLEEKVDTYQALDICDMIFACTLEMVCATTLGYDIEVQSNKNQGFLKSLELASEIVARRIVKVWLHSQYLYSLSPDYKREQPHVAMLYSYPKDVVKIRKIKEKEFNASFEVNQKLRDDEEYSTPQIFVNELLKLYNQGQISLQSLDDQIANMIVGGNETSALTTSHVILMLAMNQEIQDLVVEELSEVYDTATSVSTPESISKLDYMEKVIKETMRLLPVGPFLGRECQADTVISTCTIPAGATVMLDFHHLHRNEETWGPTPLKFNPENFTPQKISDRHPYSYLPFSGGPRNCVGMKYAWISVKIMLASLLRRYKFTTELKFDEITTKWDVTLKIVGGHMVMLEKRNFISKNQKDGHIKC